MNGEFGLGLLSGIGMMPRIFSTLIVLFFNPLEVMPASDSSLHPLNKPMPAGEVQFTLRDAGCPGQPVGIECVYQPCRERDVIKRRSWHLLGSPFRIGSGLTSVQREEFHHARQEVRPADRSVQFRVALQDPDARYSRYQLASVRVVSGCVGTIEFKRWFPETPSLDPGFGLGCAKDTLRGMIHPSGLGPGPLAGYLPLWPTLRTVDLTYVPANMTVVQLWEASAKHHWDGWRQATPQQWPGGSTIVARHLTAPTVWRAHEYHPFSRPDAPTNAKPVPPADALPGVVLEVFWPEGDRLEFPEVRFERPVDLLALPVARLTPRAREVLALGATLRPGLEHHSLGSAEWNELESVAADADKIPVVTEINPGADGRELMVIKRRVGLKEPWLFVFGAEYDHFQGRRHAVKALVINPVRWTGPQPE